MVKQRARVLPLDVTGKVKLVMSPSQSRTRTSSSTVTGIVSAHRTGNSAPQRTLFVTAALGF